MSHLLIVDGHAVAHRAYHSIPPLSLDGQPLNAIYGFYSMILGALDALKPNYLCVCLDLPGPTFRNTEFVGYRAKRAPTDHDLISQLKMLPDILAESGIPTFSMGGYEADDLIGTLSKKVFKKKFVKKITIITGDKDLMQLVNRKVSLYMPIRGLSENKTYGVNEVKERLGVLPKQVIDLKALMGDMSDNYPGVAGIGPVAATNLLGKYQSLDSVYQHLDEIKPSIRQKLITSREDAYLSQRLATIVTNIPIDFSLRNLKITPNTYLNLLNLFTKYNFKSLIPRLNRLTPKQKPLKSTVQSNQTSLF